MFTVERNPANKDRWGMRLSPESSMHIKAKPLLTRNKEGKNGEILR